MPETLPPADAPPHYDDPGWGLLAGRVLWSRRWLLLAFAILGGAAAAVPTLLSEETYTTEASFVVQAGTQSGTGETAIRTAAAVLRSDTLARAVAQSPGLTLSSRQVRDLIEVERPPGSGFLVGSVSHPDPEVSAALTEALTTTYLEAMAGLINPADTGGFTVRNVGDSVTNAHGRPLVRNTGAGVVIALVLALVVIAVREQREPVVREPSQAAALGPLLLASIPGPSRRARASLPAVQAILSESVAGGWPPLPRAILVTGPGSHAERARLAAVVAAAIASWGHDVLLVDLDIDSQVLTKSLGCAGAPGVGELLGDSMGASAPRLEAATVDKFLRPVYGPAGRSFRFLPAGTVDPGAGGGGQSLSHHMQTLRQKGVLVLNGSVDSRETLIDHGLELADATILAPVAGVTKTQDAQNALSVLRALSAAPVLTVLLGAPVFRFYFGLRPAPLMALDPNAAPASRLDIPVDRQATGG
jgi:capsular polysaccharide biosynthesis protein